jgi:hypothetical protein
VISPASVSMGPNCWRWCAMPTCRSSKLMPLPAGFTLDPRRHRIQPDPTVSSPG